MEEESSGRLLAVDHDALCINQSPTNEKSSQVALMGHIFQNAVCIFAWLGNEAIEGVGKAMRLEDLVLELSCQCNARSENYMFADQLGTLSLSWAQAYLNDIQDLDLLKWRQSMWERFEMICGTNFWRRVWIRQEIWLAADIIICHGEDHVAWTDLEAVFLKLESQLQSHKNQYHVYYPAWKLSRGVASEVVIQRLQLRNSVIQGQNFSGLAPLRSLIEACRGLQSTVTHDYVYGLVGLATDGDKLPIDYSKREEDVYLDTLAITQPTEDPVYWNRVLLEHLGLLHAFEDVAKAVENKAEEGSQWHVLCKGTSRSFILDASYPWVDPKNLLDGSGCDPRPVINPPSWVDAWARQYGSGHPTSEFPNPISNRYLSEQGMAGMDQTLFGIQQ